jgi:hypothetical protein
MMILCGLGIRGNFGPLWRAQTWVFQLRAVQTWALDRLISFNCASGDVRWAIMLLALRSFTAVWVFGQRQFVLSVRNAAGRVGHGARFGADITDADSMVAAGGS